MSHYSEVSAAIRAVRAVYHEPLWTLWADRYLDGSDVRASTARIAADRIATISGPLPMSIPARAASTATWAAVRCCEPRSAHLAQYAIELCQGLGSTE